MRGYDSGSPADNITKAMIKGQAREVTKGKVY